MYSHEWNFLFINSSSGSVLVSTRIRSAFQLRSLTDANGLRQLGAEQVVLGIFPSKTDAPENEVDVSGRAKSKHQRFGPKKNTQSRKSPLKLFTFDCEVG